MSKDTAAGGPDLGQLSQRHTRGCLPSLTAVILYLRADLTRYHGSGRSKFLRHFLFTPGFKYTVWMRLTGWAIRRKALKYSVGVPLKMILSHVRYKYGIAIPEYTDIGPGLFINRFGGIYINGDAIIGANVNIAQMSMIGQANRGSRAGSPIIGNRVFIAVGSAIVGRIHIGDGAVVGTGAIVSSALEANSVVTGNPAALLHKRGSEGYINRMVPDDLLQKCYEARGHTQ